VSDVWTAEYDYDADELLVYSGRVVGLGGLRIGFAECMTRNRAASVLSEQLERRAANLRCEASNIDAAVTRLRMYAKRSEAL